MTPTQRKRRWPSKTLCDKLSAAARGATARGRDVEVSFLVEGGAPGERFLEHIAINSEGHATYEIEDEIEGRARHRAEAQLDPAELRSAFAATRDCARVEHRPYSEPILPDSLVGTLTVRSGKRDDTVYFPMEDAESARRLAAAQSPLRLHARRRLAVPRRALPARFIRAVESISEVAALVEKAQSRSESGPARRRR